MKIGKKKDLEQIFQIHFYGTQVNLGSDQWVWMGVCHSVHTFFFVIGVDVVVVIIVIVVGVGVLTTI